MKLWDRVLAAWNRWDEDADIRILTALRENGPMPGLSIRHHARVNVGRMYPALSYMEHHGEVVGLFRSSDKRRWYHVTEAGLARLDAHAHRS